MKEPLIINTVEEARIMLRDCDLPEDRKDRLTYRIANRLAALISVALRDESPRRCLVPVADLSDLHVLALK